MSFFRDPEIRRMAFLAAGKSIGNIIPLFIDRVYALLAQLSRRGQPAGGRHVNRQQLRHGKRRRA